MQFRIMLANKFMLGCDVISALYFILICRSIGGKFFTQKILYPMANIAGKQMLI